MQSAVNGDQRFYDRRAPARQCNYPTSRPAKADALIAKRVVADYLPWSFFMPLAVEASDF
jgi:hypothetical protein